MLLGPPTAFNIAWSSDTTYERERGAVGGKEMEARKEGKKGGM